MANGNEVHGGLRSGVGHGTQRAAQGADRRMPENLGDFIQAAIDLRGSHRKQLEFGADRGQPVEQVQAATGRFPVGVPRDGYGQPLEFFDGQGRSASAMSAEMQSVTGRFPVGVPPDIYRQPLEFSDGQMSAGVQTVTGRFQGGGPPDDYRQQVEFADGRGRPASGMSAGVQTVTGRFQGADPPDGYRQPVEFSTGQGLSASGMSTGVHFSASQAEQSADSPANDGDVGDRALGAAVPVGAGGVATLDPAALREWLVTGNALGAARTPPVAGGTAWGTVVSPAALGGGSAPLAPLPVAAAAEIPAKPASGRRTNDDLIFDILSDPGHPCSKIEGAAVVPQTLSVDVTLPAWMCHFQAMDLDQDHGISAAEWAQALAVGAASARQRLAPYYGIGSPQEDTSAYAGTATEGAPLFEQFGGGGRLFSQWARLSPGHHDQHVSHGHSSGGETEITAAAFSRAFMLVDLDGSYAVSRKEFFSTMGTHKKGNDKEDTASASMANDSQDNASATFVFSASGPLQG